MLLSHLLRYHFRQPNLSTKLQYEVQRFWFNSVARTRSRDSQTEFPSSRLRQCYCQSILYYTQLSAYNIQQFTILHNIYVVCQMCARKSVNNNSQSIDLHIHQLLLSPGFMCTVRFMYSRLPLEGFSGSKHSWCMGPSVL